METKNTLFRSPSSLEDTFFEEYLESCELSEFYPTRPEINRNYMEYPGTLVQANDKRRFLLPGTFEPRTPSTYQQTNYRTELSCREFEQFAERDQNKGDQLYFNNQKPNYFPYQYGPGEYENGFPTSQDFVETEVNHDGKIYSLRIERNANLSNVRKQHPSVHSRRPVLQ